MENTITISQERYDELIRAEMRVKMAIAFYEMQDFVSDKDIKLLLGVAEEKANESNG
jgi:hypothetical protein